VPLVNLLIARFPCRFVQLYSQKRPRRRTEVKNLARPGSVGTLRRLLLKNDPAAEGQPGPNTYSVRGWPVPLVDAAPALDAERVQRVAPGLMAAGCAAVLRLPALASPLEALKKSVAATKSKSAARDGAKAKKPAPKKRAAAGRK
jgi:hypothetical protein